jgi:hypothetical protein
MYADAFGEYQTAQNINENGTVVMHPRTGSPIDNPYLRIRDGASKTLRETLFAGLKTDALWA